MLTLEACRAWGAAVGSLGVRSNRAYEVPPCSFEMEPGRCLLLLPSLTRPAKQIC